MSAPAKQTAAAIGKEALLLSEKSFQIPVKIISLKEAYGRLRLLVSPVGGIGEEWVDVSRIMAVIGEPNNPLLSVREQLFG